MKRFFLLLSFAALAAAQTLFAQNNLKAEYKNAASVPNFLNVCGDADNVIVTIKTEGLSGAVRSNVVATLQLFKGVEFLSLDAANTSPGVVVTNISNRNRPVFSLPDLTPASPSSSVQIAFNIAADCAYVDSIAANNDALVFDTWRFTYDLGSQTGLTETDQTDEYRTAFKVPTFTASFDQNNPPPVKVGDCYSRTLTVANSALEGFVDTLNYTDKLGAGVYLKALYVNGLAIPFTKTGTGADTTIRAVIWGQWFQTALLGGGLGDGDVFLDPNERIVIREEICFVNCTKSTLSTHTVGWGCKGKTCTSSAVNGFVQKGDGAPNAVITHNLANVENVKVGYCKSGTYVIHYTNNGSEIDPGFATMKDVEVQVGMGIQVLTKNTVFEFTNIRVAGQNISPVASTTVLNGNPLFGADPDGAGGLSDEDGDGFFDDLRTGRGFDVVVDFTFSCDSANMIGADSLCLNEFNVAWNAYIKYTDPCKTRITKSLPNFGGVQNTNEEFLNCIDPDAYPGQQFLVQHIETRGVRTFEKDCGGQERLVVWVAPPPGVTINVAASQLFKNNSTTPTALLSSTVSNDTTYLFFDATGNFINGKYDFRIYMTPDCSVDAGRIEIPFGIFHSCPPCGCKHSWYCSVLDGPQFHPTVPPCPQPVLCPKGLQTTDFDVERTTFGFTSNSYTTPMNPANANKNVAIFCDTVKMTVCNVVGQTPVVDSLGVVISYDNVDYVKDTNEIFLFKRGLVRIKKTGGQVFTCLIDSTHVTVVRDDTTKVLTFRFDECLDDLGITLAAGDSVKFYGWFTLNPTGPMVENFRKVPNLRAYGFAIFDGEEFACDNFGENFFVSKIPTVFATPGGSEFPRGCSLTPFQYRLVTKNVGFSQYYTGGEFYAAVKVDSFVLDYDTMLVHAFGGLKTEVSIPGHPTAGNGFYVIPGLNPSVDKGHYVARFDTLTRVPAYNNVTSYSFNIRFSVVPGCESLTGSANANATYKMNPTMYYTDRYFAKNFGDGSCADERAEKRTQNLAYSNPPAVDFEPVTNPNLLLAADTAVWIVKQCNTSITADALLTWLAASYDTAQLQIVGFDVIDIPATPQILTLENYSGGVFATTPGVLRQAANNTATQICNTIRIRAVMKQCGTFPVRLSMGWNCAPYSDPDWTPEDYDCPVDTLSLTVTALDPSLDATVVNQPPEYPSLCDTLSMEVLVRNTGQGTALDMRTRFSIPLLGATLVPGSVEVAYPSDGAFIPALFDPQFVGTTARGQIYEYATFDSLHAGLAVNGLPGFDPLLPGGTNEYKVRYSFTTGCSFVGGVQTLYSFKGKKVCGLPTNTESGESLPIQVAGISAAGQATFEVGFGSGSLLASNGTSTLEVFAKNSNGIASDAQDKIQVKLPPGINYQNGSSVAVQPLSWVPGDPTVEVVSGITILSWTLPVGMVLDDLAVLQFDVTTPSLDCNDELEASVLTIREVVYTCPGGSLTCPVDVITSDGGEQFFNLNVGQMDNFAGPDETICPGGSVQLDATTTGFSNYNWSPADGLDDPTAPNPSASPSQTTTYTISAQDSIGCLRVDNLTVTVLDAFIASTVVEPASCGADNGTVTVLTSGGSGNFSYNWLPAVVSSPFASGLAAGNYLITVTDNVNGCTDEAFAAVPMIGSPVALDAVATAAPFGNPTGGSVVVGILAGEFPMDFVWNGPVSGFENDVLSQMYPITDLSTGTYVVTVTDDLGCTGTVEAFVPIDLDTLTAQFNSISDTSCCYATGVIFVVASGGDGLYSVDWSPQNGVLTNLGGGLFRIDSVESGVYSITVSDGTGATVLGTVSVANGCICNDIFEDEVILVPEDVEKICIGIPFILIDQYPIFINGVRYLGPFHPCDFDSVVYYAFSFLQGNGYDGPFKLGSWQCGQKTIQNIVFEDIYDLVDSMNVWDPNGFWILDEQNSLIYGGDGFDQYPYGPMKIIHLPTWTPFTVKTNYTGFAYGTEIFVSPFDGKAVVTAYDSTTCCADSVCIIFVNPCEDLLPTEPLVAFTSDPSVCFEIPFLELTDYYVFMDRFSVFGTAQSCNGGLETRVFVPNPPGVHELIVIDTSVWCADTGFVFLIDQLSVDTMNLTTPINLPVEICVDTTVFPGNDIVLTFCELPALGDVSAGSSGACFVYTPTVTTTDVDTVCVIACDEYGVCDTTIFEILLTPASAPTPTQRDTFFLTTEVNTPIFDICLPTNELQGPPVGFGFCENPSNGVLFINAGGLCFAYSPNTDYIGLDSICVYVCDGTNTCDTSIFIIMVETADTSGAMPNVDTVFISTPVNTPYVGLCLPTDELNGSPIALVQICESPQHGNFLASGSTCMNFVPEPDFIGLDAGCLYLCDSSGVCDTTIVMLMVTPNDSTPNYTVLRDTIYLTTIENTPIAETCMDTTELPGTVAEMSFCHPVFGFFSATPNGIPCFSYEPTPGFSGTDEGCIIICDDMGICDTTVVILTIEPLPPPPAPTLDTLEILAEKNVPVPDICLDLSELTDIPAGVGFCLEPAHGVFQLDSNLCLTYLPDSNFVGADTACVVVCDSSSVCDSTIIFIVVENPPPPTPTPTPDTLYLLTEINVGIADICLDLSELGLVTGAIEICDSLANGSLTADTNYCLSYLPDPDFVGFDSVCVYVCDASGTCDTTFIFILVENPPNLDTLFLTTEKNVEIASICLDFSELADSIAGIGYCELPAHGGFDLDSNLCLTYVPDSNFVGLDTACIVACDTFGVCDTTIIFIAVEEPILTTDTLLVLTEKNIEVTGICLDISELGANPGSVQFCGSPANGSLTLTPNHCLTYTPDADFVGEDSACVFVCDGTGLCDTTLIFMLVENPPPPPVLTTDTLLVLTEKNVEVTGICLDISELGANVGSVQFCGSPANGSLTLTPNHCLTYTPDADFVGEDSACVYVCDGTGLCDTTLIFMLVENPPPPPVLTTDTLLVLTEKNVEVTGICLDISELGANPGSVQFCGSPANGSLTLTPNHCLTYTPDADFVGEDSACVYVCDGTGLCDTTLIFMLVENPPPPPVLTTDTLLVLTEKNVEVTGICLDLSELGANPGSVQFCGSPANGSLTLTPNHCLTYTPDADFVGEDSACVYVCDGLGLCDTTLIFMLVENPPPPPVLTTDTLLVLTEKNVEVTGICLDISELGANPGSVQSCGSPANGSLTLTPNHCLTYTPDADFVGEDSACVFVCDGTGLCDTTLIFMLVENPPPPPVLTTDTLIFLTEKNLSVTGICLDLSELGANVGSVEFCGSPSNGSLMINPGHCLTFIPLPDFVGDDAACVYVCDGAGYCDTTHIFITVENPPPPPVPVTDTLHLTTQQNVEIIDNCLDLSELGANVGAVQFCGQATNGSLTVGQNHCLTYTPDADFVGTDEACVYVCDGAGLCDTTYFIITVEEVVGPVSPTPDTLFFITEKDVEITSICLDISELGNDPGPVEFCGLTSNGALTVDSDHCLSYAPDADFVGTDAACLYVCDDAGTCDTTYIFILVKTPTDPGGNLPNADTLFLTTTVGTPLVGICLSTEELTDPNLGLEYCGLPTHGTFSVDNDSCLTYTPNAGFEGLDGGCLAICDGNGVCDTFYLFILVTPVSPPPPPTTEVVLLTTTVNVAIEDICLDLSELGANPGSVEFCGSPVNGTLTAGQNHCLSYTPNLDFFGLDSACVYVCDGTGVCDTTFIYFLIETPTDQNGIFPNVDTLFLTTTENVSIGNICLSTSELTGASVALTFCEQPQNGSFSADNTSCLSYTPNAGFIGLDLGCAVVCDDQNVCDTFILVIAVVPEQVVVNPEPDTIFVSTDFGTPSDTFCIPMTDLGGPAVSGNVCGLPQFGTLVPVGDSCFIYTPDAQFVGTDAACLVFCDGAGKCDTTVLIFNVLPPTDCGIFDQDSITLEIPPNEQFGEICLENFPLNDLLGYEFFDNGLDYTNGYAGCNYDSCFAYTYFTVPNQGEIGPYRLDFWYFNGDTITLDSFQNIEELVDSFRVWDPQADWTLDSATLTIRTCAATWLDYGDMKITQLGTAGIAEIEINVNLEPLGTQIKVTPGQHLITVFGEDCTDTLWINVIRSNEINLDTFIYMDAGFDTLCLADFGVFTDSITDVQYLCSGAGGTMVSFAYDTLSKCVSYDGLAPGLDSICLKFTIGTDSCLYFTLRVTVLEPLPCNGFLADEQLEVLSADCSTADACIDLPFALLSQYSITENGLPAATFLCDQNQQGIGGTGISLTGMGAHVLIFEKTDQSGCRDTLTVNVSCDPIDPPVTDIFFDTIYVGQMDSLCVDTAGKGLLLFIDNICQGSSGLFVDFQVNIFSGCVRYTGLDEPGTDTACIVACFGLGGCDTVTVLVTVLPQPNLDSLPPVAVTDVDTVGAIPSLMMDVLKNDTLKGPLTEMLILRQPHHGAATIMGNNHIFYEVADEYCDSDDPDSLQYVICNPFGCDTAWVYMLRPCTDIKIFNGFSPNNDGMNETFTIEGVLLYPDNHLQIFDRWGLKVLDQKGYRNGWKGTWEDKPLPDGVYFYLFEDGEGHTFKGYLMLHR